MKIQCKYCLPSEGIDVPEFTPKDKKRLVELKRESGIRTVKFLMHTFGLNHLEAKFITLHINESYCICKKCGDDLAQQEFVHCSKCAALNFNWEVKSLS